MSTFTPCFRPRSDFLTDEGWRLHLAEERDRVFRNYCAVSRALLFGVAIGLAFVGFVVKTS